MSKTKTRKKKMTKEPSRASLRDIPELDFSRAVALGRGASGLRNARALLKKRQGRPKSGMPVDGSSPRSIRFSDPMWRELERRAKRRGVTLHALLREVIAEWLTKAA
jgi:hypothetical protein